jgi:signal transduction histidine kinase
MTAARRLAELVRRLHAILGAPGLMIGLFALLSFGMGLYVLAREYDRPRQTGRDAVHRVVDGWVHMPSGHLSLTLVDCVDFWREAPPAERPAQKEMLRLALEGLGRELDRQPERFPLIHVTALEVEAPGGETLARWVSPTATEVKGAEVADRMPLTAPGQRPAVALNFRYRVAPNFEDGVRGLEVSYRRLLLGLLGLSGFSLLCLAYMVLNARALSERVAREAAQDATLDLADRTCHELGNGVFVLTNERRNLSEHLDLVERFIAEEPLARDAAARHVGLDPNLAARWDHALKREYAARGIDPDLELRGSAALARHVCRQIDVCSEYISLTVRELDGFLKRTALPVITERVDLGGCLDEALSLLQPRLEASGARVVRRLDLGAVYALADRRLLIHALVNLIKNAIEAVTGEGGVPELTLSVVVEGRTAWIAVADNGPGIRPEASKRIFDLGSSTKGPGRGRGLAIVRESVLVQHGEITVENRPGGGAEFRIGLEVDPGQDQPAAPPVRAFQSGPEPSP